MAAAITTSMLTEPLVTPKTDVIPAAERPVNSGVASGIVQHAAHAPATPKSPRRGFFIAML